MNYKNNKNKNSASKIPKERPLHPRHAGSVQAKSKSQSVMETSSSVMCSLLSNKQIVTADFILDPPPTCKGWTRVFLFFLESEASKPPMSSPQKNPYGNTSCDCPADAWVLINQVTLVSSSSSLCIRVHCILQQLLPPVMIRRIMHRQIHNKCVEDLLLFTAPDNPAARCKVDVRQVQIQVTVKQW